MKIFRSAYYLIVILPIIGDLSPFTSFPLYDLPAMLHKPCMMAVTN